MKRFAVISMALLLIAAMLMPVVAMADQSAFVGKTYYIKTNTGVGLNMRNACSEKSSSIIKTIPYGTAVVVQYWCENKKWAMVEYDGRVGYVFSRYLSSTKPEPIQKKVPANAKTDASTYAEGNPPMSIDLYLNSSPIKGCYWVYTCSDTSSVTVVENGYHPNESEDGTIDQGNGIETFRLDGIAYGDAIVRFDYLQSNAIGETSVVYSITYYVLVNEDLDVIVFSQDVEF